MHSVILNATRGFVHGARQVLRRRQSSKWQSIPLAAFTARVLITNTWSMNLTLCDVALSSLIEASNGHQQLSKTNALDGAHNIDKSSTRSFLDATSLLAT
jgi:hypothetical protein